MSGFYTKKVTPIVRSVEENLRIAMRGYSLVCGAGHVCDYPGLAVTSCGLNTAVFNSAMLTEEGIGGPALLRIIRQAQRYYAERKLGWTFWLCEDLLEAGLSSRASAIFRRENMPVIAHAPGMFTESLKPHSRPPAPLEIRRIENTESRLQFAHLSSVIFSLSFPVARQIYAYPSFWTGPITGWIGYHHGEPVSVVTVVIGAGVAGVYSLGTLPQFQGRGFGETILRHALGQARLQTGSEATILQTTREGMSLYLRMGYRVVTRFSVFLKEGCD